MATMTVSLPDPMKDWIEKQIKKGDYASASDYVRDLVRKDRARQAQTMDHGRDLTLDELRKLITESRASGVGHRSVDDLFAEAERITAARGDLRE